MKKLLFWAGWLVLIACFFALILNNKDKFNRIEEQYGVSAVNLDKNVNKSVLAQVLDNNSYVDSKEDAEFLAEFMAGKLANDTIPQSILELKTRKWQIPTAYIEEKGTPSLRKRLDEVRAASGWSADIDSLYRTSGIVSVAETGEGEDGQMTVVVKEPVPDEELAWWMKLAGKKNRPSEGVVVRLQKYSREGDVVEAAPIAYACTDNDGRVVFKGLSPDNSYSVLPIRKDISYGSEKGTYRGTLAEHVKEGETVFEFTAMPMKVRMFQNQKLVNMRDGGVVTVRTPAQFNDTMTNYMICFLVGWLVLFIIGNHKKSMDSILAVCIMMGSGLSMLLMFGINDPLTERVYGYEMAEGSILGVGVIILMMLVNIKKFFKGKSFIKFDVPRWMWNFFCLNYLTDWMGRKSGWLRKCFEVLGRIPCVGYLLGALFLSLMLWMFGQKVGGMTVNLNLFGIPVQPSEIIKFMFVVFISAFFFEKGDSIVAYSDPQLYGVGGNPMNAFRRKLKTMGAMIGGVLCLMVMYMLNSDMGPALVVSLTFIVLYSLVKSKVVFNNMAGASRQKQLLHADISMLIIGVLTFILTLFVGYGIIGMEGMKIFALLWLIGWLAYGWINGKRIYETALMFNLIICFFVFGEGIFRMISADSIADRLADRNSMCVNTWGTLDGEPGINTQVAEGLWGLASGGFTGQGLGNAQAHYIPAYHTDMILQSIGEIMGFFGVLGVILLLSILLRRSVLAGYRSGHTFLLYLCSGIAIVTGIQFFIIALGSLGMIPLTGISVPFFSFGRVSLILNCMAFGVVLSISARNSEEKKNASVSQYNLTVGMLTLAYTALAIFVLGVVAHYQVGPARENTLIREMFVYDTNGAAVVKYNPRIAYLTSRMNAGDIYDRNGILLATSDPQKLLSKGQADRYKALGLGDMTALTHKVQKRYYPLGEHLYFMVGDANNQFYFNSIDTEPYGYLAEAQHLSLMRGYDNRKLDENRKPVTQRLVSGKYKYNKFMPADSVLVTPDYQLRDYSVLLPFLKEGNNSSLLKKYNQGEYTEVVSNLTQKEDDDVTYVMPKDIQLTVDAELQMKLQKKIPEFTATSMNNKKYRRYERYSIVVLDAVNGDLLASANYPLPDFEVIEESKGNYNDNDRPQEWKAYTERDLGLTYATKPGSTGKVMSSLAGLMHMDKTGYSISQKGEPAYTVYKEERIHTTRGAEPPADGTSAKVNLNTAIVQSSNCYFINLVNDLDLYDELAQIYGKAGHRVELEVPYKLKSQDEIPADFIRTVTAPAEKATSRYRKYIEQRNKPGGKKLKMKGDGSMAAQEWMWAWGEGSLDATPAAMARVAATAATGMMPAPRFLTTDAVRRDRMVEDIDNLEALRKAMKAEARKSIDDKNVGGKTGTPERPLINDSIRQKNIRAGKGKVADNKNDGWYIAFIDNASTPGATKGEKGKIAVAVRIERTMESGSGYAKRMMKDVALPVLRELEYIE